MSYICRVMKNRLFITVSCFFFILGTSCIHNFDNVDKGLDKIVTIKQAIEVLGPPDKQSTIEGTDYYEWSNDYKLSRLDGSCGSHHYAATLKFSSKNGKVIKYWYDGNAGGMIPFLNRIEAAGLHLDSYVTPKHLLGE